DGLGQFIKQLEATMSNTDDTGLHQSEKYFGSDYLSNQLVSARSFPYAEGGVLEPVVLGDPSIMDWDPAVTNTLASGGSPLQRQAETVRQ
ncbi:hypothetical protein H4R33_001731, partial [Dimargaris cristalligena]